MPGGTTTPSSLTLACDLELEGFFFSPPFEPPAPGTRKYPLPPWVSALHCLPHTSLALLGTAGEAFLTWACGVEDSRLGARPDPSTLVPRWPKGDTADTPS